MEGPIPYRVNNVCQENHLCVPLNSYPTGSIKVCLFIGLAELCGLHTQKGHQWKSSEMGFVTGCKIEKLH